jgi:ACS family tartrate transporter-like MFS transporter
MDEAWKKAVLRKVSQRLIPFLFLLYVVNILDRINVSFARLRMLEDLGLSEEVYAFGFGLFYIGYLLFEVPSNLILSRTGARRWIARIMVSWGLITSATMLVRGAGEFYLLRILLGFAEAGFFPGIILYLTYWFPARERARMVAFFMAASPLTGVLGNPISGAIMQWMDQMGGLHGWQWVFLLEGIPSVLLGLVVLVYLTDRPEKALWLTEEERHWLAAELASEDMHRGQRHARDLLSALLDGRVWLLIALYFTVAAASNAFGSYLPKLVKDRFSSFSEVQIGLLCALPNLCAVLCMIANGTHSDRTGERRWHVAVPAFLAAAGWALAALTFTPWLDAPLLTLAALALVQSGIMSMLPTFWTLPTAFLRGVAAAGGIALINSVGNLGGFAGPNVLGQLKAGTGSFVPGLLAISGTLCVGGILALCVRHHPPSESHAPALRTTSSDAIIPPPADTLVRPQSDRISP